MILSLPALPLSANGKLDRKALPAPGYAAEERDAASTPPRTAVEEIVAGIWTEILGLTEVGVEDDFFALGGHSLRVIQVTSRLRRAFGVEIPLARLFEATTLAALAAVVEAELAVAAGKPQPPALRAVRRDGALPLSFSQRRQWFLDQLEPGNPDYNMPGSLRLALHVEPAHLESALNEILRRHEVLRTTFRTLNGEPYQVVAPEARFHLPVIDLRALPSAVGEKEALRLAREELRRPFDLAIGPLIRLRLLRLAQEQRLLLPMHHIASDGWSMAVLQRELTALYEAYVAGRPSPLPALPIQYADYAVWQQEWLRGEVLEAQLAYWREILAGAPPRIALPFDRPRPALQTFRGARQQMSLPVGVGDKLKALSRRQGGTLFMTFLGVFCTLLQRHSGETDISVGTYTAGRNRPELEGLIGFFVNTLVLRNRLDSGEPFSALLDRLRQTTLGAFAHQDLPFEKLLEELRPERNLSHTPLFQVMLEFQNVVVPGSRLVTAPEGRLVLGRANFDLTLWVRQVGDDLGVSVGYNRDLFDEVTIARLIGHCQELLVGVGESPSQPLAALPLLPMAERHHLVYEWSGKASAPPTEPLLVHRAFEMQAAAAPDALAVVHGEMSLSYGELNRHANRLAWRLRALGVGPEVRAGLCLDRSPEMLIALLAILKAGGAYVPLDPAYPPSRLGLLAEDSRCRVLLTRRRWVGRLPAGPEAVLLDDLPALAGENAGSPAV
ncbi:MAG TPA: condensation domain-containing protein, partial [Thermoanaerobaculia bacterium]